MGYLFLGLALLAGLTKAYCGKRSSHAVKGTLDAVTVTSVRMLLCCVIGVILPLASGVNPFEVSQKAILLSSLSGLASACFTVSWLLAVSTTMYMMVEVFVTGGVIIPLIVSNVIYGEPITVPDIIGVLLLLVGIYLISVREKGDGEKWNIKGVLLLIFAAVSSGGVSVLQKMYTKECPDDNALTFNLYVYVFAAIFLVAVTLISTLKSKKKIGTAVSVVKPVIGYVAIMAVCLFLNSYFMTRAASNLDSVILYPMNQGLAMVFSSVMSVTLFKEKLNLKAVFGIALTIGAIVLINVF